LFLSLGDKAEEAYFLLEGNVNIYKKRNEEHIKHDKDIHKILKEHASESTLHDPNVDISIADLLAWSPEVKESLPVPYMHVSGRKIVTKP
jgi:hypothetical protein